MPRRLRFVGLMSVTFLLLTACSSDDPNQHDDHSSAPSPEEESVEDEPETEASQVEKVEPEVKGDPEITYREYGLPETSGWDTAIVFTLRNPTDHPVVDVNYRVELRDDDGQAMERVTPDDRLELRPGESRVLVEKASPSGPNPPSTAKIRTYTAEALTDSPEPHEWLPVDPTDKWVEEDTFLDCDTGTTVCEATGDLTWEGNKPVDVREVALVVRNDQGDLVAAGADEPEFPRMDPGETLAYEIGAIASEEYVRGQAGDDASYELHVSGYSHGARNQQQTPK